MPQLRSPWAEPLANLRKSAARPPERVSELVIIRGLEERPIGRFQLITIFLGFAVLTLDGLDFQLLAIAGPSVMADLGITRAQLGPAIAAALIGMALGGAVGGWVGDRWGRRPAVIGTTLFFGGATLATGFSGDFLQLTALRFISGLGFGAAVPNVMALGAEWTPVKHRARTVGLLAAGTAVGGLVGSVLASLIIPAFGWRGCFILSGAVSVLLVGPLIFWLPESAEFLVQRGRFDRAIRWIRAAYGEAVVKADLEQIGAADAMPLPGARKKTKSILTREWLGTNLALWLTAFGIAYAAYGVMSWAPTILSTAGFPLHDAVRAAFYFNVTAMLGPLACAWAGPRYGLRNTVLVLIAMQAASALALPILLQSTDHLLEVNVALAIAGFSTGGLAASMYTLAAVIYPTACRSRGLGGAAATIRIGGIVTAVVGGVLLSLASHPIAAFFLSAGLTLVMALVGILILGRGRPGLGRAA
jgi:AAHS family 4-hydroxybenzoate transporter-like MFS transporter